MAATTSTPRRIEKVSSDNIVISFDLLSNLTYMASLAAAELPREKILQKVGEQRGLKTSVIFEQVNLLAQRLGIEYTRALQLVAAKTRAQSIKSLLLRFASTIASGESEHLFIRQETRVEGGRYANEYARSVENLKKWTDAYAAVLVSVTLIVVVALVSTLLGALEQSFILMMGVTMFAITSGGVYVILRTAPYEQITYDGATGGPPERARARFFLRTLGPLGLIAGIGAGFFFGVGYGLITFGVLLLPGGFYARLDDRKVRAIDSEVSTFVRSLGAISGATNATISAALNSLDLRAMGSLSPHIVRLRTRLLSQLPTRMSWERFKSETGNELLNRSTEMLLDGVEMGGNGEEVGQIASSYASSVAELRLMRGLTSSSFTFLVVPMHIAMTGLLLFILQIVATFEDQLREVSGDIVGQAQSATAELSGTVGLGLFESQNLTLISGVITMAIVVMTVANALAPKVAAGGHNLKIVTYLSLTSITSGLNMLIVPAVAGSLLGSA